MLLLSMTPEFIHHPTQFTLWMAILSVCVGSFITLLVYRLPLMSKDKSIGLFFPASFCPACKKPLKYWQNIPILAYILLRGKCGFCKTKIKLRYFIIECCCFVGGGLLAYYFGPTFNFVGLLILLWVIIAIISLTLGASHNE